MKHGISTRWLANPNQGHSHFPYDHVKILFIIKVKILMLVKWSYRSPQIMPTIEPRMIIIIWARNPIIFKHKSFWYPFMEANQTTHHLNIGVLVRKVTNWGLCTSQELTHIQNQWQITYEICPKSISSKTNVQILLSSSKRNNFTVGHMIQIVLYVLSNI